MTADDAAVLRRALDQLAALLDDVPREALGDRTPCEQWSVSDLVDHVVAAPANFARMARGESIDWSAPTPSAGDDPATRFRVHAEDLLRSWGDPGGAGGHVALDWICAELAVHTWDLATALGVPVEGLDPEVAETGMGFMRSSLRPELRGEAFGPEQPPPADAGPYARLAAFAGRVTG